MIRCAIYTRKSSDEGLEQDFNSLDAQREACAAYIASQTSEGWKLLPDPYDDGGISGGTLERPALQRLLADLAQGRIDIIVVYKVDRLTRSLIDFAKLVEAFDRHDVSFVSVTQSFNTTTSMGRLTLNMLLSFAQFEREVTAERIRDKIAASKAKGMWMGGTPPLGYAPNGRSLTIVEEQAALVRDIYRRYRQLGNVRSVADALAADGIRTPRRTRGSGKAFGGVLFSRGQLYSILKNPIYAGDIAHKGTIYPGNHDAIIQREDWEAVQQQLVDNTQGVRQVRQQNRSLLAGLLFDEAGNALQPVHTTKGNKRYRYYISRPETVSDDRSGNDDRAGSNIKGATLSADGRVGLSGKGTAAGTGSTRIEPNSDHAGNAALPTLRMPATEIEPLVRNELAALFADPIALLERAKLDIVPSLLPQVETRGSEMAAKLDRGGAAIVRKAIDAITVHPDRISLSLSRSGLASLFGLQSQVEAEGLNASRGNKPDTFEHIIMVRLKRSGLAVKLIQDNGVAANTTGPDRALVRLICQARSWWEILSQGEIDISTLSHREKVTASYMTRVLRLAFLAPDIVEAILAGTVRAGIDAKALIAPGAVDPEWKAQKARMIAKQG